MVDDFSNRVLNRNVGAYCKCDKGRPKRRLQSLMWDIIRLWNRGFAEAVVGKGPISRKTSQFSGRARGCHAEGPWFNLHHCHLKILGWKLM